MSGVSSSRKSTILTGRKCFLCQNTRYRSKHCRLFRFPVRGTAMWNRWLSAMDITEEAVRLNEHPRMCQRHFDPKDFLTRQLSGMAVPVRNLRRIKHMEHTTVEEERSFHGDEPSGVFGSEYNEITDAIVSECEEADDELPDEITSINVLVEEQSVEAIGTTSTTESAFRCSVPNHKTLEELLSQERGRAEELLKLNAQQKHIIEEQRNLLRQLGVECELADDSD